MESIVEHDRLQEIANNCIREDYPLQPWYVQSYRTATAVLIVSDITGFVKSENVITGQTILNENMNAGQRVLSGAMGTVEGLLTTVPGAKVSTTLGKTALKKVGVSAASIPFGEVLLRDVTCNLGDRVTAKLLQTAAGQGLIKAFNKVYYSKANVVLWGLPPLRQAYVDEVRDLSVRVESMRTAGLSEEMIARAVHQARRNLGIKYKDMTDLSLRDMVYKRNLERYGDPLGPSIEYLRNQGKSWTDIINSALKPGGNDLGF